MMNLTITTTNRRAAAYPHEVYGLPNTRKHGEWTRLAKMALRAWRQGADSIPGRMACIDLAYCTTAARYLKTKRKEQLWLCTNMKYPDELMR